MTELPKQYDPKAHEEAIYQKWEASGAFQPSQEALSAGKKPYVVMLPPPNITGTLHMGHALQDTIMDILIRWHRMMGEPVLWLPGTDHAALPTNKILVDQLAKEGKTLSEIGREEFLRRADQWYEKIGNQILNQMKRLGASADWSRKRFTMDSEYYHAVQEAFVRYFKKGYIYRGARIVNWDPKTQTTVSDLEIDWKAEKVPFYILKYGPFEIGTARPETKFGDKYVVMHPADSRYQAYQSGQKIELEWINGKITATVVKDESVDQKFGTGVMTMTPWHDTVDFEIAARHDLDLEQIIGFDGKLLPIAGEFAGLTVADARPAVVEKLKAKGLLVRIEENYEHNIALNDRGKGVIEPQVMRQWFVDMKKVKKKTMTVSEKELVKFIPPRWKKNFLNWMEGVHDWNINRQIWLGHRLPVWWKPNTHGTADEKGSFVVSIEKPTGDYEQDPDVLDTWFSSALWPFATLGWPENTADLQIFYPTSVLVTGRDILYLWVARMIFSGLEFMKGEAYGSRRQTKRLPFQEVFIHPTVLTKQGQRMSKSLGTGVDPLELIEKYGADATRFGLMYQMSYDSQAIKFDEEAVKSARNFANKIWNIARFLENIPEREKVGLADRWIQTRLAAVAGTVSELLQQYKFGEAARLLYEFVWKDFADWYVEVLKVEGSVSIAKEVFQQALVLLHPFMPHLTEALWKGEDLLLTSPWPAIRTKKSQSAEQKMNRFQAIVSTIRSARTLLGISPAEEISVLVKRPPLRSALKVLTRSKLARSQKPTMKAFPTSQGEMIFLSAPSVTPAVLSDVRNRLQKRQAGFVDLIRTQKEILSRMQGKAPAEKVEEKKNAIREAEKQLAEVTHSLELLE